MSPESSSSRIESRSLVCRAMMRPEVYDSWNSSDSRCVWRNTRFRRSMRIAWLRRADMTWNSAMKLAPATPVSRYAPTMRATGIQSPCPCSAGSPRLMPAAMSAGPATCSAVDSTMTPIVAKTRPRTGRTSEPSRCSERRRICRDSAFEKSSLSSPSTPVTLIA